MSANTFQALLSDPEFSNEPGIAFAVSHMNHQAQVFDNPFDNGVIACDHQLITTLAKHPAFQAQDVSNRERGPDKTGALRDLFNFHPVFLNEPRHQAVRKDAFRALGWTGPANITSHAKETAERAMVNLVTQPEPDLVSDFALELAVRLWGELNGLGETETSLLRQCAPALGLPLKFYPSAEDLACADTAAERLWEIFKNLDENRLQEDTLLLVSYSSERDIDKNRIFQLKTMLASMSFDAVDGVAGLIANGLYWLIKKPELQRRLRENPADIAKFWAETARLSPTILGLFRSPIEDVHILGLDFQKGQNVLLLNAAGNRDPRIFDDPNDFQLDRNFSKILSFGGGARSCVGKSLSRLAFNVAIDTLLNNTTRFDGDVTQVDWGPPGLARTVQHLPFDINQMR